MKKRVIAILGVCAIVGSVLGGCAREQSPGAGSEPENLTVGAADAVYCYAEEPEFSAVQAFSKEIFRESLDDTNPVLSPVSAYLALALTGAGANGETAEEFAEAMGDNHQAVSERMMENFSAEGEGIKVILANSAWVDNRLQPNEEWVQAAAGSFDAEVYRTKLSDAKVVDSINTWIEDKTEGLIKDFLSGPMSEDARLALLNTVYFKGEWERPFEANDTLERPFILESGTEVQTEMMSKYDEEMTYVSSEICDGIVMPYKNSDLKFVALKPVEGMTVREIYNELDMAQIGEMLENAQSRKVALWIPKFEVTFDRKLNEDLQSMGITSAFDPERADFSGIGTTESGNPLYIDLVRQKAVFILDEEGTEAAATMVMMNQCCALEPELPLEVHFDKPFLYMILDPETDVPLFMGVMDDPSMSGEAVVACD